MLTTSEAIYDALKAAVESTGLAFAGRILWNEQTPRTSRERAFFLISPGWGVADGQRSQVGYKWVTEQYIVRISTAFKAKRQETQRALAYADAQLVADRVDTAAGLLGIAADVEVTDRVGPVLARSGDFIQTDLVVGIRYQRALPAIS